MFAKMFAVRTGLAACLALGLGFFAAPAADAATVQLLSLKAIKTEDHHRDELHMEIRADNKPEIVLHRKMVKGETWILNRTINFNNLVRVRLLEHDQFWIFSDDDVLGTVLINKMPGLRQGFFSMDGAKYVLTYRVLGEAYTLRILDLKAVKTQEFTGDEIRMRVTADKDAPIVLNRVMKTGQVWHIHKDVDYDAKALVRLFDVDFDGDPADPLGTLFVGPAGAGVPVVRTHNFVMGTARYTLTYQLLKK